MDVEGLEDAGVKVVDCITPKTGIAYRKPIFDDTTIENLSEELLVSLVNRMITIDYRNRANRPESQTAVRREKASAIAQDQTLTDAEKVKAMLRLNG